MNRWYQIRRLRGAVYLIMFGVLALLNEWRILKWHESWPLFLIVAGLLMLAERSAWVADMREQQTMRSMNPPTDSYTGQPVAPGPWTSAGTQGTFIQPHPPTPEDSGREDR